MALGNPLFPAKGPLLRRVVGTQRGHRAEGQGKEGEVPGDLRRDGDVGGRHRADLLHLLGFLQEQLLTDRLLLLLLILWSTHTWIQMHGNTNAYTHTHTHPHSHANFVSASNASKLHHITLVRTLCQQVYGTLPWLAPGRLQGYRQRLRGRR